MIPAIITVRTKSSRLPQKCLLPFGDGNVLEHIIRRVKLYKMRPIVSTTEEPEDDIIVRIADMNNCEVYRGSTEDKLMRWLGTCEKFGLNDFYTADADDPFFCGNFAERGYRNMKHMGYDIVYPIYPAPYVGHMGYSLTTDVLRRACAIKTTDKTEMMWNFIEIVPGIKILRYPESYTHPIRLTLDYQEDYILLKIVLKTCGWDATKSQIVKFFRDNEDTNKVNWFRNKEWKRGQCVSLGLDIPV